MSRIAYTLANGPGAEELHADCSMASTGCSASCEMRSALLPGSSSTPWRWATRRCTTRSPACRSASSALRPTCPLWPRRWNYGGPTPVSNWRGEPWRTSPLNIAGFVGADHTAVLLASGAVRSGRTVLVVDIGTNTEISVAIGGQLWTCSCAWGAAFEGAHIHDGMRAAQGAIERVSFLDGRFQAYTIAGSPPRGICGSGILGAVAAALRAGVVDERGGFYRGHPLVTRPPGGPVCTIVPSSLTAHGREHRAHPRRRRRDPAGQSRHPRRCRVVALSGRYPGRSTRRGRHRRGVRNVPRRRQRHCCRDAAEVAVRALPTGRQRGRPEGLNNCWFPRRAVEEADEIARSANYVELTTHPGFADTFGNN